MDNVDLLDRVRSDIQRYRLLCPGDRIIVGVSGGADSVCLLKVLVELRSEMGLELVAVHVNHCLRGQEADEDQEHVRHLCRQWDVPYRGFREDIKALSMKLGLSLEAAGREARYRIFNQVLDETGANGIAVAHNREDQAETIMLHILRGTGLDGLCGMSMKQGSIIRPLLNISRKEILRYLEANQIPYRVDSSNNSSEYTRNRIRNDLFPKMEDMFGIDPTRQLIRLAEIVRDDRDFLDAETATAFKNVLLRDFPVVELSAPAMRSLPEAITKRIIRLAWERINNSRKNLEQVHVDQIMALCQNNRTGKKVPLPCGFEARLSYNKLIFMEGGREGYQPFSYVVEMEGITRAEKANGTLRAEIMGPEAFLKYGPPETIRENSLTQLFDLDRINGEIMLRNRRDGDRIRPYNSGGEKKLKEFFIDHKIPGEKRSAIPLIALGNKVVWIVGMRTSEDYRARRDSKNIWVLSWFDFKDGGV